MKRYFYLFATLFLACNTPSTSDSTTNDRYAHIKDEQARSLLRKAIDYAGGLEKWEAMQELSYTKGFKLFLASGEVEKSYKQTHQYRWNPYTIDMLSREDSLLIHTTFEDGIYVRTQNGKAVDVTQEALEKALNTSVYVVSIPFKLLDPGSTLTYEGKDTLSDGKVVDVLQVAYNAADNANHTTSDVWKYYVDKEGKIVANWVDAGDHFSLIENLTYERVEGILFNKHRKSFRVDSVGNKQFLRAEYFYDNYNVRMSIK